jgi:hypothetical protein
MGAMKTTVEISDSLMREARKLAKRQGVSFRDLVERSLQRALIEAKKQKPFRLRPLSFKGSGLRPELKGASWERFRELIYEGHGG